MRLYQITLSPLVGNQCRFYPSCSNYALDALRNKPAWRAVPLILWRIVRCNPLCKGGFDELQVHPGDHWYRIPSSKADSNEDPGRGR